MTDIHEEGSTAGLGADSLELEQGIREKLFSVVGDDVSVADLISRWREIRPRLSEHEAVKVEAAIRRHWRRR